MFDADAGGVRAADRGVPILLAEGIDVTVVRLPQGQDPDDFLRDHDAGAFETYVENHGEDLLSFLIRRARERHGETASGSARAAKEVLEHIGVVQDEIQRDVFLNRIAQAFGVERDVLRRESRSGRQTSETERNRSRHPASSRARLRNWEQDEVFIVQASVSNAAVATRAVRALSESDFRDAGRRRVFLALRDLVRGSQSPNATIVLELLKDDAAARAALETVFGWDSHSEEPVECVIERIVARRQDVEYRRLREETRTRLLDRNDDDDDLNRRLNEVATYHKRRTSSAHRAPPKDALEREEEN
jgi:DNA primase